MFRGVFDLPKQKLLLGDLQKKTENPEFWSDQNTAREVMKESARLENIIDTWERLESAIAEATELAELFQHDSTQDLENEIRTSLNSYESEFRELEVQLKLSGEYDNRPALISVHAGSGGTDAQDWAELLLRMYLRWANSENMNTEILSITNGDEAGIKSADFKVSGDFAYGLLRSERGVHRLVRISPFDSAKARHTSFALIEICLLYTSPSPRD